MGFISSLENAKVQFFCEKLKISKLENVISLIFFSIQAMIDIIAILYFDCCQSHDTPDGVLVTLYKVRLRALDERRDSYYIIEH